MHAADEGIINTIAQWPEGKRRSATRYGLKGRAIEPPRYGTLRAIAAKPSIFGTTLEAQREYTYQEWQDDIQSESRRTSTLCSHSPQRPARSTVTSSLSKPRCSAWMSTRSLLRFFNSNRRVGVQLTIIRNSRRGMPVIGSSVSISADQRVPHLLILVSRVEGFRGLPVMISSSVMQATIA